LADTSGHRDSCNEGLEYTNQLRRIDRCCRTDFRSRRYGDGKFSAGFALRRGLPRQSGKSGKINHSGLVVGDSHGWTVAGIFYHGTRGYDDLCTSAPAEVL